MTNIGILAYGSLIHDPGAEIKPLINRRVNATTPFPVEYARISGKRGGAPTLVPHTAGKPVRAEILGLRSDVSLEEARDLLWRRETRQEGTGRHYTGGTSPNSVLVRELEHFQGFDHVLYTDFPDAGKTANPDATGLAMAAVESVSRAKPGSDGISYLIAALACGIETAKTPLYQAEILRITGASDLHQALALLQRKRESTSIGEHA